MTSAPTMPEERVYRVGRRRKLCTYSEATAIAGEIFARTGVVISIERVFAWGRPGKVAP